jgi:hypothetical protein
MPVYFDIATNRFHTDKAGRAPRMIRLAWARDDADPRCVLVQLPDGEIIEPSTERYHWATAADLDERAYPIEKALSMFLADAVNPDIIVSFNSDFHHRQLNRALETAREIWLPGAQTLCLMVKGQNEMMLPLMRPGGGLKSPSFAEACHYYLHEDPPLRDEPVRYGKSVVEAVRRLHRAMA